MERKVRGDVRISGYKLQGIFDAPSEALEASSAAASRNCRQVVENGLMPVYVSESSLKCWLKCLLNRSKALMELALKTRGRGGRRLPLDAGAMHLDTRLDTRDLEYTMVVLLAQ